MIHVIVVNGRHRSGKNSFIYSMIDSINDKCDASYECISSINICKQALKDIGWDGHKDDEVRQLLSDLKKFAINNGDLPTKILVDSIIQCNYKKTNKKHNFFITQIREKEEIDKLETACNGLELIGITFHKVFIKGNVRDNTKGADTDNNLYYDDSYTVIKNNSTLSELGEKASKYINDIMIKEEK